MFITHNRGSVLALDAGTTSIKAAVIDAEFRVVSISECQTQVLSPAQGLRELDMDVFGEQVFDRLADAMDGVDPSTIAGIAITGQGDGAWLLDVDERPLGNAILWNDARSAEVLVRMREAGEVDRIRSTTHGSVHPGSLCVIARYLKENDPQRLSRVHHHLHCKDWVRFLLTGALEAEASDACRSYLDTSSRQWDSELMNDLGDLAPETTLPVADAGETRPLRSAAAARLGLPDGLPVGVGLMDVAATGYAFCKDQPNQSWAIVGTTSFVGVVRSELNASVGNWMAYGCDGLMLNSLAPMTGTPLLEWAKRILGHEQQDWECFAKFAREGAVDGVRPLMLPYLAPSGERAPFADPFARGSLHGLTYDTTPANFAWSVFAGVALSIAECIDDLRVEDAVQIAGGGSSSDLLCQLVSDFSGRVLQRSAMSAEAGLVGAVRKLNTSLGVDSKPSTSNTVLFRPSIASIERLDSLSELRAARDSERVTWQMMAARS